MQQLPLLLKKWQASAPHTGNGILVGCDQRLEWLLPWWWQHYTAFNIYPVTFIDFGMSEIALNWCRQRGQVVAFEIPLDFIVPRENIAVDFKVRWRSIYKNQQFWEVRNACFKKPFALLMSPYQRTLWIDLDCEIKGDVGPLFKAADNKAGLAITPEPQLSIDNLMQVGLLKAGEKYYNGGVLAYTHGAAFLPAWTQEIIEKNARYPGDSAPLSALIRQQKLEICELPSIYNWRMALGANEQAIIIHWVSDWGKQHILEEISKQSTYLAVYGGPTGFTQKFVEQWQRPKDQEKQLIGSLIDRDELSGSGYGIGKEFENAFRDYIGCNYCLSFSHGTAALMAAYYAAGVGPGDEILTPAVGYIAGFSGAMHLGARPIFCDIDPHTLLVDPNEIKKKITKKTKAINLIHLNGRICDLDAISKIGQEYGLALIQDGSHCHGAEWNHKKIGNSNHLACFSLQGINPEGKPVSSGEGGIVCTNNQAYYQKMLSYCHVARRDILNELQGSPYERLDNRVLGLKWRAHPLAMALGLISLQSLEYRNSKRRENYLRTIESLKVFDFISFPETSPHTKMGGYYGGIKMIYDQAYLNNLPFKSFISCLAAENVPIHELGVGCCEYRRYIFAEGFDLWGHARGPIKDAWHGLDKFQPNQKADFPIAEEMDTKIFSLPCFIEVSDQYYIDLVKTFQKIADTFK